VRCCKKSGDRTGATRGGAGAGHAGPQRAARVAGRVHERGVPSVRATAGPRPGPPRSHRRIGAPPPPVRGRHDLSETAPGRTAGESQARRAALRRGSAPGAPAPTEEGTARRSPTTVPAAGAEPGLVSGFRLRLDGRRPRAEVPDDRRRCDDDGSRYRGAGARPRWAPRDAHPRPSGDRAGPPRCVAHR